MDRHGWYRPVDAALLRASVGINPDEIPSWPDGDDIRSGPDADAWRAWIGEVWAIGTVADAVAVASPMLADRVAAVRAGEVVEVTRLRRIAVSLAGYLVRVGGRATPFGLFAGVAPLRFGTPTRCLGLEPVEGHQPAVRADAAWLAAVITSLESASSLLDRLTVVANDLAEVRGDRIVVSGPAPAEALSASPTKASDSIASGQRTVSLRFTAPVRLALQATRSPVTVADLVRVLAADFPEAGTAEARALVETLVRAGALITSLRPSLTTVDGLGHVIADLAAPRAGDMPGPETAQVAGELTAIHRALAPRLLAAERSERAGLTDRMRALADVDGSLLAVDLRLGDDVILPSGIAAEAASAASALVRLSPHPEGPPALRDYHRRFLERFGPGAVVPVSQLVSLTTGLGYPDRDLSAGHGRQTARGARDEWLLALVQQAGLDDVREVVLDDSTIDRHAPRTPAPMYTGGHLSAPRLPSHLDLCVQVLATSATAMEDGDFRLRVTGIGQSAVATSGRFLPLLSGADRARLVEAYVSLPGAVRGALPAQVSFPPCRARAGNVLAVPRVLPVTISVGEHPGHASGDLHLDDLGVTADLNRMYLLSLSRRRVVEPMLVCAAARQAVPPLALLLVDVARATSAAVGLFDWAAAGLPFLPRLRYRRTILAPARWRVPRATLPDANAPLPAWMAAADELRKRLRLPEAITIGTADRQLRLQLAESMDVELLRAHVRGLDQEHARKDAMVTLTEAPADAELGWCSGRAHEVLIPMASTATPGRAPQILDRSGPLPLVNQHDDVLPGAQLLYAKVYGDPDGFTAILVEHLSALLAEWDTTPGCWFVRYQDPRPHLRIRVRTTDYGGAAARTGAWVAELRGHGLADTLTLDTYRPEPARYGRGAASAAAETLFAADSAAAIGELAASTTMDTVAQQAMTAASLADLAGAILGSRAAGMAWLLDQRESGGAGPVDRETRRQALRLSAAYPDLDATAPPASALAERMAAVAAAWRARRDAAIAYADLLRADQAGVTPAGVVGSLLHLHHNRIHGPGAEAEARTHRLARAIALADAAGARR